MRLACMRVLVRVKKKVKVESVPVLFLCFHNNILLFSLWVSSFKFSCIDPFSTDWIYKYKYIVDGGMKRME
jgi:hypothetical protein